jgi:S1-C subfamily serine protease
MNQNINPNQNPNTPQTQSPNQNNLKPNSIPQNYTGTQQPMNFQNNAHMNSDIQRPQWQNNQQNLKIQTAPAAKKSSKTWIWFGLLAILVPLIIFGVLLAESIKDGKLNLNIPITQNSSAQSSENILKVNNPGFDSKNQFLTTTKESINPIETKQIVSNNLPAILSMNITVSSDTRQKSIAGTGYIVSEDGIVVTNRHVMSVFCRDPKNVKVVGLSYDDKVYEMELESIDPVDDIAILRIKNLTEKLPTIKFGDSSKIQLGEDVLAIGNALGTFNDTVTKGIISGVNRSFDAGGLRDECNGETNIDGLIQTDAAINPGNSGGPLFNSIGEVIGMNSLGSPDAQSIGLAIPSNTIKKVLESYQKNKVIIRPRLGVVSQEINPVTKVEYPSLPVNYGEFIGSLDLQIDPTTVVSKGSIAEEIGLKYGDIIIEINGKKLNSQRSNPSPLRREILNRQVGEQIELTVLKAVEKDGQISYQPTPKTIKFNLKGIYYDLAKKSLGVTN